MTESDQSSPRSVGDDASRDPVTRLLDIVTALRSEGGCPWDRAQTLQTLKPYLLEESYELLDAIDADDAVAHREELGDVLLQVVLQAQIRREASDFSFEDVAQTLADKLVRRHPHVFGSASADTPDQVVQHWEEIKAQERADKPAESDSVLSGVPRSLPALFRAERMQSRAARVGFDWPDREPVLGKIKEELSELEYALTHEGPDAVKDEMGDLLFAMVNLCRHLDVDAEEALSQTNAKFKKRFEFIESTLASKGQRCDEVTLEVMDQLWDEAKTIERQA